MMNYERIDRGYARILYNLGEWIYILPSKMAPNNPWMYPMGFRKENAELNFDALVDSIKSNLYVCCKELGKGVKFYQNRE